MSGNEIRKHGPHGQSDVHPRERPGGCGIEEINALHAFKVIKLCEIVLRLLRLRHHHLGHEQPPGGGHEARGNQIFEFDAHGGVARHDGPRDAGQTAHHDGEELGGGHGRNERSSDQGGFRLPYEDVRCGGEGFGTASAQNSLQSAPKKANGQPMMPR